MCVKLTQTPTHTHLRCPAESRRLCRCRSWRRRWRMRWKVVVLDLRNLCSICLSASFHFLLLPLVHFAKYFKSHSYLLGWSPFSLLLPRTLSRCQIDHDIDITYCEYLKMYSTNLPLKVKRPVQNVGKKNIASNILLKPNISSLLNLKIFHLISFQVCSLT